MDQRHGLQEILAKISTNIAQVACRLKRLKGTNTRVISRKGCGNDSTFSILGIPPDYLREIR